MRDRLGALPLFADLDDGQLDRLASCTSEFEAPAGQALIERGRPGSGLFILEEGKATVEAAEGTRELGPGDVFGERALLEEAESERRASARRPTSAASRSHGRSSSR